MDNNNTKKLPRALQADPSRRAWKFIHDCNSLETKDLNRPALTDGVTEYSYGSMFHQWERYAALFSALKMTEETNARVGILGTTSPETLFAIYGLNMVGAQVSIVPSYTAINTYKVFHTVKDEKLTDIIVTDEFAQADLIYGLLAKAEVLGLRNVLILHMPAVGPACDPMITVAQEMKYASVKQNFGPICIDTLLNTFATYPIHYASDEGSEVSMILHTSGTTGGMGKPVPLSDRALNSLCVSFQSIPLFAQMADVGEIRTSIIADLSNGYAFGNQVHMLFSLGGVVATVPYNQLNPKYYKSVKGFGETFLFGNPAMFQFWQKTIPEGDLDLSTIRATVTGGSAFSVEEKMEVDRFLKKNGCKNAPLFTGYGLSETCGSVILDRADLTDDAMGYLMPDVEVLIYNEDEKKFHTMADIPCEGVLYLRSPFLTGGELDGKEVCHLETVNGKKFLNTNDAVKVEADGKFRYLGRSNRFFVNDSGNKYQSGKVEAELSRAKGIAAACVVPLYEKTKHDNLPLLCVTLRDKEKGKAVVEEALEEIFRTKKKLAEDQLPWRVLIAEELPRNNNGKVDIYKINRGEVEGITYEIIKEDKKKNPCKIVLEPAKKLLLTETVMNNFKADLMSKVNNNEEDETMKLTGSAKETYDVMNQMGRQVMNIMKEANKKRYEEMKEKFEETKKAQMANPMFANMAQMFGQMNPMGGNMPQMFGNMNQMFGNMGQKFGMPQNFTAYNQQFMQMNQQMAQQFQQFQQFQQVQMLRQMQQILDNIQKAQEKGIEMREKNAEKLEALDKRHQEMVKKATVKVAEKIAAQNKAEAVKKAVVKEAVKEAVKEEAKKPAAKKPAAKKKAAKKKPAAKKPAAPKAAPKAAVAAKAVEAKVEAKVEEKK